MFTPSQLEAMPLGIESQFKELENRIMSDIVRRIKDNGEVITQGADWQIHRLRELGKSKAEIKAMLKDTLNVSDTEINRIYNKAIKSGYAYDKEIYNAAGVDFIPFQDNKQLQQLIAATIIQTNSELKNITQSLGFAVRQPDGTLKFSKIADYYQKTLDGAMLDITTGAFDYNTVLKRFVAEMTNSGLRSVDYASGWSNRVDVAARRAVMTGITQVTGKVNEDNAKKLGTDMYEVSWHSGARPSHLEWQGGWYSYNQLVSICGLGTGDGLCGWNCYHSYSPVIPGLSEPTYTEDELKEMRKQELTPHEYNGKQYTKYEALQKQRRMETTMRAQRQKISLLQKGNAKEDDIINAKCRYQGASQEYAKFSKAMGLPQQRERVTIDGLGNIGAGKTKIDLTKKDYNDILHMKRKMSDIDVRKWYKYHNENIPNMIDATQSVENQARQACYLRNKHRFEARELMKNQEKRKQIDIDDPITSFDDIVKDKMARKGISFDEAVADVLKTSTKTRKSVNKKFGLED